MGLTFSESGGQLELFTLLLCSYATLCCFRVPRRIRGYKVAPSLAG